jgi:hypothetical protein
MKIGASADVDAIADKAASIIATQAGDAVIARGQFSVRVRTRD